MRAVLYEILTGKRAFEGQSHASVVAAILDRDPPPPSSITSLTPPVLDRLVHQCLSKSPDDRPDTAHDVANELRWMRETSGAGARTSGQTRRRRHTRTLLMVTADLLLVMVGATLMYLLRPVVLQPLTRLTVPVEPSDDLNSGGSAFLPIPVADSP